MTGNLGAAGTTQGLNITPGSQGLLIVCASMRVLGVLEECCKDYANRFTHVLVKLINRVARDHASPGGFVLHPVVVHVPGKPSEYISLTEKVNCKALLLHHAISYALTLYNAVRA